MYKQSDYNYFVPYREDKVIYYNAVTRNSFVMSRAEHERIHAQFADPISFELGFPTVFLRFKEWGFFVEEGVEETAVLRFRHNREVLYSPEVHIVVCITKEMQEREMLVAAIKKHVDNLANATRPPLVCIEWTGEGVLGCYEEVMVPVINHAQTVCRQQGIALRLQMQIEMEADEVIHDKLHHDKGIPTYRATVRLVEKLCSDLPDVQVLVEVGFTAGEEPDKAAFTEAFTARKNLLFAWIPKNYQVAKLAKAGVAFCSGGGEVEEDNWYQLQSPRLNQYAILDNGNVYSGKPKDANAKPWGSLTGEGKIEWDEPRRAQVLGTPWFETEKCRKCKHLYLFSSVCSRMDADGKGFCCLDLDAFAPENIVVAEFEQKST